MFDWSAVLIPWLMFAPFFVWIMFQSRRNMPLTPVERRRALVIGSIGSVLGIIIGVTCLAYLVTPSRAAPAAPPQAPLLAPPAPAVPPPVRVPQPR